MRTVRGLAGAAFVVASVTWAGCGSDASPAIVAPVLLAPYQGQATGSVWSARTALRPVFRWTSVDGADGYELEVDDSCTIPRDCDFPSPEIDEFVATTSFTAAADLPVSMVPPVGRRYFWRVRACNGSNCHPWSPARYFDAGRQRQDFNGDGYADLAMAAAGAPPMNALFVFAGGTQLPTAPAWSLRGTDAERFSRVLWAGDMNGDGFADLVAQVDTPSGSLVRVYTGAALPPLNQALELTGPETYASYVWGMLAAGDLNGDTFADLFLAWPADGDQEAYVVSYGASPTLVGGSQTMSPSPPSAVRACDLDADGFTDLVESRLDATTRVFSGGPDGPFAGQPVPLTSTGADMPVACLHNANGTGGASLLVAHATGSDGRVDLALQSSEVPADARSCAGTYVVPSHVLLGDTIVSSGGGTADVDDVDGDGFGDGLIGQPTDNRAILLFGGCPGRRFIELPGTDDLPCSPAAGYAVAGVGDVDGDGYPDLAVGNPYFSLDSVCGGQVYVYRGGPNVTSTPAAVLVSPDNAGRPPEQFLNDGFGVSVD